VEGISEIRDLSGGREGVVQPLPPNASLGAPFAAVPILGTSLEPGRHDLACAVFASDDPHHPEAGRAITATDAMRAFLEERCPLED
jgi:hypothetical protein